MQRVADVVAIVRIAVVVHIASTCLLVGAGAWAVTVAVAVAVAVSRITVPGINVVNSTATPKFHLPCRRLAGSSWKMFNEM